MNRSYRYFESKSFYVQSASEAWCRLVLLAVCLALSSGLFAQPARVGCMLGEFPTQVIGEVGTYQISNICQLQSLSAFLEMPFVPANPTFRLGTDIDAGETQTPRWNNGKGFAPIGATYSVTGQRTGSPGFSGTFDGRGYRISNLFIYRLGEEDVGLFARLSAAADIRNLIFFEAKVTGSTGVGILAGRALDSTISNITVTNSVVTGAELVGSITGDLHRSGVFPARVTASMVTGQADVGGVVGRAADSTISRITVTGSVVTGSTRVGTLAGSATDGTISRITVTDSVVAGDTRVGGVAGRAADSTISRITATNSVVTGGELVGGVIGDLHGISASLSAARVTASTITGSFGVGGVAGHLADGRISTVRVTDSTIGAEREGGGVAGFVGGGMVQGSEAIGIVVTGSDEAEGRELGGLVGHLLGGGVIRQSYATGVVGDPERDYEVGGLVGHVREGALVENSYAWVRVGGDGSVGGLVGVNQSTISNSYAYSVVTPRNPSGLTGLSIFVGLNGQAGANIQSEEQGGTIEGSYAAGTVNGEIPTTLAGDNSGTITGSSTRTLSQLRCPTASSRFCAEGEPETFAGWDSDIWYFGSTHTLPVLKALTRIPATPTDVSLEWSTTNSLVLRSASVATYYELGLEVGESSTVLLARSPNFELGNLSRELRGNLAGGDSVSYTVRISSEMRVVNPPSGDGNVNTQIVTEIVSPPFFGSFTLLDVPGTPTSVTASDVTAGSAATRKVRVTVSGPDNDGYGRQAADSDYGSQVDGVDLNFAYVVKILDGSGIEVASTVQETTSTSVMIVLDGLKAGTQYTVKASARNVVGSGGTLEGEFTTSAGVPEAPIIAPFWENTLRVVFSWEAPYDGGSTITSYRRRTLGSGGFQTLPATQTRFVFDAHEPIGLGSSQGGLKGVAFFLQAVNDVGAGSESTAAFAFLDVPGAPTTVTVSGSGANTVRVTVNGPGNDGYGRGPTDPDYGTQVDGVVLNFAYVVKVLDGSGIEIASTVRKTASTSVMIDFDGLSAGTQYTVRAFVRNVLGSGGVRMRSFTTSAGVPEAPMTASSWGTTQSLVLSWSAPHHGGSTITAYVVTVGGDTEAESTTRLDSGSTMLVVDPSTLRSVFQGGGSIAYSVQAVNAVGDGSTANETFTLLDVPGTPTSVTATGIGTTTVQVTVNAPDNDGYGRKATNTTTYGSIVDKVALNFAYVVNVTDVINGDSVSSMTKATTATSVTLVLGGLKVGTQYQIVTFVQNAVGASDSLEGAFKTNAVEPGMPELLDPVWKSTQSLVLSWTAPHNGGSTITTYVVTVNGTAPIQLGSTTMYVVVPTTLRSDFQGGDTIAYTVRALNAVGSGSTANETFTLLDVPGAPTVVTASDVTAGSAATRKVRVMVSGPDNDGYGRELADPDYGSKVGEVDLDFAYVVKVLDGSGKEVASMVRVTTLTSVMIVFDGLRAGTQYQTVVSARNVVGEGNALEEPLTTNVGVPDAPIVVSFWETTLKEVFSWDEPYDGGSAITKYNFFGGEIGPHDIEIIAPETTFAPSIPAEHRVDAYADFQGGDTITYSVRATNDIGNGSAGTVVSTILNVPSAPTTVTVSGSGANTVRVTVIGSDNDGYGRKATDPDYGSQVDGIDLNLTYVVKVFDGSGKEIASTDQETTSTSVIFDFADLKPGTQYQIVTFVQNAVGASDSLEGAFKTNAVEPGMPELLDPVWKSTQSLVLSWTASPNGGSATTAYVVTVGSSTAAESTTRLGSNSTMHDVGPTTLRRSFQGGDTITYSVQAVNAAGDGSLSIGTFVLLDVPGTPTSVTATGIGTTTVQVTVIGPDNDGYGRKAADTTTYGSIVDKVDLNFAYKVSILNGDQIVSSVTMLSTEASVTIELDGLRAGTQYQIVTFVQNAVGASDSLEGAFKTNAVEPGMPELLDPVWKSTQSLVLSWTAPHHGGSTITTYVVTVSGDTTAGSTIQLSSNATMHDVAPTVLRSIRGVYEGGAAIAYSVRAVNAIGDGVASVAEFTLLDVPGTPTSVTATGIGTTTAQVTVIGSNNDGYGRKATDPDYGSQVDGIDLNLTYVVKVIDGSGKEIASTVKETTSTSVIFDFADLKPGTQYRIVTFSQNAVGPGGTREEGFMTGGTSPADSVRLRLRGYLGGAVR